MGVAMALSTWLSGTVFAQSGGAVFLWMAGLAVLGGGVAIGLQRRQPASPQLSAASAPVEPPPRQP
jgi:hypothetical protein